MPLHLVEHPLVQDALVELRDARTEPQAFRRAARGGMKGILGITDEPLVSSDFKGCRFSTMLDASCTQVVGDNLVKLIAWYDNECGFSNRVIDLFKLIASK